MPVDAPTSLTVSVALCTRNGAAFIGAQLDSILNQTRPPQELVVSDDDSTDATLRLVRERVDAYRARGGALEFQVFENHPALGVAANFAQAIAACRGDLIALSDQDDVWHPERLEIITRYFAEHPDVTLVHGDARRVDADGRSLNRSLFESLRVSRSEQNRIERGDALDALIRRNLVTGATAVFRRALAEQALPIPDGWIHDEWLAMVAALIGRVAIVPGQLVDYRQHGGNEIGAAELTARAAVSRLREPGTERNRRLSVRAQSLADRFGSDQRIGERAGRLIRGKVAHERYRAALPAGRVGRAGPVLGALVRGEYRRYGLGARDAARDLVQPR